MKVEFAIASDLLKKWKATSSPLFVLVITKALSAKLFAVVSELTAEQLVLQIRAFPQTESPSDMHLFLAGAEFEYDESRVVPDLLPGIDFDCCLTLMTSAYNVTIYVKE